MYMYMWRDLSTRDIPSASAATNWTELVNWKLIYNQITVSMKTKLPLRLSNINNQMLGNKTKLTCSNIGTSKNVRLKFFYNCIDLIQYLLIIKGRLCVFKI